MNAGLQIDQLIRFYGSRSHEHDWYVALLHELPGDAPQNRSHGSAMAVGSHHDQRGFVLDDHLFDAEGSFADAHIGIDDQARVCLDQLSLHKLVGTATPRAGRLGLLPR